MATVSKALDSLPSMGWICSPSPLGELAEVASNLGLGQLLVKRDDQIEALGGGNKVRKLDVLAATPPYSEAQRWHATGAIGSGHLVACARACEETGRDLFVHCCDQPISDGVVENLAMVARSAKRIDYVPSRLALALRRPHLFLKNQWRGEAIVPPGGTSPAANAGFVRAAFELAAQLEGAGYQAPDRIYLPLGSGGAAGGLAIGLALAGLPTAVHAVSTVEKALVTRGRIRSILRSTMAWLRSQGVPVPTTLSPRLLVDTSQIGHGYAHPSQASRSAAKQGARHGLRLEPVYSGKAMAALLHDAKDAPGKRVLFWVTCHGIDYPVLESGWKQALPRELRGRLEAAGY